MHLRQYSQRNLQWTNWKGQKNKMAVFESSIKLCSSHCNWLQFAVWNFFNHILMTVVLVQHKLWSVDPKQEIIAFESRRNRHAAYSSVSAHTAGLPEIRIKEIKKRNGRSLLHIFFLFCKRNKKKEQMLSPTLVWLTLYSSNAILSAYNIFNTTCEPKNKKGNIKKKTSKTI